MAIMAIIKFIWLMKDYFSFVDEILMPDKYS